MITLISKYILRLVLGKIFMTLFEILFDFCLSSIFSHLRFDSHLHINFRIYIDIDTIIFFNYFCSCKNYLTSNFSLLLRLIRNRCRYTPILTSFLKHISHINKIPWCYNKHLVIT